MHYILTHLSLVASTDCFTCWDSSVDWAWAILACETMLRVLTQFKQKLTSLCILHQKCDFCYVKDRQILKTSLPTTQMDYWGFTPARLQPTGGSPSRRPLSLVFGVQKIPMHTMQHIQYERVINNMYIIAWFQPHTLDSHDQCQVVLDWIE